MPDPTPSTWKVTMMLADHAEAINGKLYITGGGWSLIGPAPTPLAVAARVEVPWGEGNRKHTLRLELQDEDGSIVQFPGPAGMQAFVIQGEFETGRPAGLRSGTPLDLAFALNIGPLQLEPGKRYAFRLTVLGTDAAASCTFTVRDTPAPGFQMTTPPS